MLDSNYWTCRCAITNLATHDTCHFCDQPRTNESTYSRVGDQSTILNPDPWPAAQALREFLS